MGETTGVLLTATTALLLSACGGDATEPVPTYENIAGTYSGPIAGTSQGFTVDAMISVTITQNQGNLSGSWGYTGTVDDGVTVENFQGTGTLTGTMQSGQNPSVNITIRNDCRGDETVWIRAYSAAFSGAFDSANDLVTISGPLDILDDSCSFLLSFPSVILLSR